MRVMSLQFAAKLMALVVTITFGVTQTAYAQRGGGHGHGGGGGGHAGAHFGGGGGGGGGHVRGGGSGHVGGAGHFNSGNGNFNPGNGNVRAGGHVQGYYGPGNSQYGYSNRGAWNGRSGNNFNNSWYGNGQYYGGRNAGNQALNGLARIYGGNYGFGYGGYPYAGGYRYGVGYRGFGGYPYGRFGLGAAFGPYGYGYFPWYGGLGLYGGLTGLSRVFGNGVYGSGYYNNGYGGGYAGNGGAATVYQQPEQPAEPQQPVEDYVPQVNVTSAQLGTAAAGNAVLGVTIDPDYPSAAVIRSVTAGAPAEVAGLRPGDMIASINDRVVQSPSDVVNLIASMRPGDRINIQFVRPIPRSQVREAAPEVQPGAAAVAPASTTRQETPPAPPTPTVAEPLPQG